jgi:hypothetical protein
MRINRSGFSLVLSLTIMAAMVMMVIVLASFLQVESRLAQSNAGFLRARFNALASARIAIAQLQVMAGPDQRVTMRADMFAPDVASPPPSSVSTGTLANPNKPAAVSHQRRYWTGIWATGGVDASKPRDWNVADPHDTRLFLGWLTSPLAVDSGNPELADANFLNYYLANRTHFNPTTGKVLGGASSEGQTLINLLSAVAQNPITTPNFVRLVGGSPVGTGGQVAGSVQWPAAAVGRPFWEEYYGAVDLPSMPMPGPTMASGALGARGRYAYWIGDEGIKAKVNLPDANAPFPAATVTEWDKGFAGSAAQRSAIESVTPSLNATAAALLPGSFSANYQAWRATDILSAGNWSLLQLPQARSRGDLSVWAARQGGGNAAGETMATATRLMWHEITPMSFSVLSDTLNGGMKTDLSTAFELPYSVFRTLEMYPGQKNPDLNPTVADRRQSLFHGAPNATFNPGMASDLDYNRPNLVDKIGSAQELLLASPRAAEWAPRYLATLSSIGSTVDLIKNRNGGETPERLGFAYEVPLASNFFNADRLAANLVSLTAAANERSALKNDALPWSDIRLLSGGGDPATHPDNWTARIVRGPTWDLYRNFYRMYKREIEAAAANGSALRGQGAPSDENTFIVRGLEPLTYATGNRGLPTRRNGKAQDDTYDSPVNPVLDNFFAGGGVAKNYFHRSNLADGGVSPLFQAERRYRIPFDAGIVSGGSTPEGLGILPRHRVAAGISAPSNLTDSDYADSAGRPRQVTTTRTWPTSPTLAPTILRFSTIYSAVRQSDKLGMTVDPLVVIHNPYDVPLEFEGLAMVTSGLSSPFRFIFRATGLRIESTEWKFAQKPGDPAPPAAAGTPGVVAGTDWAVHNPVINQTIDFGDVVIGGGENDNRSMSFRIVAGSGGTTTGGRVIRLEPGEIKVVGTSPSSGNLVNSGNTNVSVPADIGFELSSRAFYRLTPFHNVRARLGSGARNATAERVLWTMDFGSCEVFASYDPDGSGPLPAITSTNIGVGDATYAQRLNDLWNNAKSQRRLHDAFPSWDGSLTSLEAALTIASGGTGRSFQILTRNQGWVNYNGYLVGAEGETITHGAGADTVFGTGDDAMVYARDPFRYVAPTRRNGRVSIQGNQSWNFYLLGKKSIDGGAALDTHRRWFGTPDEDSSTYIQDPIEPGRLIRRFNEGSLTANGFNQVDESLLLNFQAMTSGWPMYSNPNTDDAHYTQPDREWSRPLGYTGPTPSFYIKGSNVGQGVPTDPEFNTGNGKGLEVTASKADTLFNSQVVILPPNTDRKDVFMLDFVLRAADMTRDTDKWYPRSMTSVGFGMNTTTPTSTSGNYGANFVLRTPEEMRNAPMTPYFLSYRAQQAQLFGYDGKAHTPVGWVETQRVLASGVDTNFPTANGGRNAYWGPSVTDDGVGKTNVILFPIPRRPLLSLSQLGTVAYAEVSTDADLTVGSSFAHPGIGDLTRIVEWPGPRDLFPSEAALASDVRGPVPELGYVAKHMGTRPVRNRSEVRTDHAFAANYALWDTYYFSGLNLQANSYSHLDGTPRDWPSSGADLPIDNNVRTQQATALTAAGVANATTFASLKTALNEGRRPLANKRMTYFSDGKRSFTLNNDAPSGQEPAGFVTTLRLPETEFPHPKYLARTSLYDGGFNVNSTSRAAWRAVLGGLKGQTLPDAASPASPTATALTKFARAFGPADSSGSNPWTQYRELTETQIDELAGRVVEEVRIRGPFMSLGDFINRRLVNNDTFGLKGALQAAIDKTTINTAAITAAGGTFDAPASTAPIDDNTSLWASMYHSNWYPARTPPQTNWWREQSAYPNTPANKRFPSIRAMKNGTPPYNDTRIPAGLGAPGIVTQMDVLNSVGPNLTARSDTFVVRAYGEAQDDAGNVIGKAWVEVAVQRSSEYMAMAVGQRYPEYVEPTRRRLAYRVNSDANKAYDRQALVETYEVAPPPNPPNSTALDRAALAQEQRLNRILGRRFRATGIRWLAANEI